MAANAYKRTNANAPRDTTACTVNTCVIPCKNGGRCIGNNLCRCPNGLRGDHCEIGRKQRSTCKCSKGSCRGNKDCKCHNGYHCRRRFPNRAH
ncbi:hypothetical protein AWZ03_012002 [Drosophila navojoa]|uniref:EGF-like domain-containing protein n=1 Tax=Drosophila navojoa TaxID=7232 RepID=A0A484AYX5_DRONA|nr:hypothetical protein AWZ03_012002 [Drosophila navojoa]